ncbi:MAG: SGNH/GDSL hydrolase family protein [Acetobacteraceae bacterium]|nr:SGNH/GDSL hydrolase family protein [Acetobacteraceae bacterium]
MFGAPQSWLLGAAAALALVAHAGSAAAQQSSRDDWIGTWAASPQPVWRADFPVPLNMPRNLWNQTLRQVARVSIGGHRVRVVLSNEYGDQPLVIGAAHVANAGQGSAVAPGSDRALIFGGESSVVVPPGAPVVSDPVDLDVAPLGSVTVSLFLPETTPLATVHWEGVQTATIAAGNHVADAEITPEATMKSRAFLSEIMVEAPTDASAVVTFGDSITDGANSTPDANHRWPDVLAERLQKSGQAHVAVLNEGISGAQVLRDRMGVNALARFDDDVAAQPHASVVVLMMGINDIGWPGSPLAPHEAEPSVASIIDGYKQLIARAHLHGLRIVGATLTPFAVAFQGTPFEGYYNEQKEQEREAVNAFIRSGAFDGVIDFDAVVRDPADPKRIQAKFDSGDHLHPNDAGYAAMADTIDLGMLAAARH